MNTLFSARALLTGVLTLLLPSAAAAELVSRAVLVEMFGTSVCAECPSARSSLLTLEADFGPEDFLWVEYHVDSDLENPAASDRRVYYGDPALPTLWFDGEAPNDPAGAGIEMYRRVVQNHLDAKSPIRVDADYFFDETPGFVKVEVSVAFGEELVSPEEYVIRAVVWESEVRDVLDREWDRVVRAVPPPEPLTVRFSGELQTVFFEIDADPSWRVDLMEAAAFVQRDRDRFVLNSTRAIDGGSLNPIPTEPIDASGITLFQNRPNPAPAVTRIEWALEEAQWVTLKIYNVRGQVVRVLNDGFRDSGRHQILWDGTDFRGTKLMSGLYLYELATPRGLKTKRLTLIR